MSCFIYESDFLEQQIVDRIVGKPEIDICEQYDQFPHGIGYRELRFCSTIDNKHIIVESNNEKNPNSDDESYVKYLWNDLTDYEKETLHALFVPNMTNMISSCLGFKPPLTLLYPEKVTNITYKIVGKHVTDSWIEKVNEINDHLLRIRAIKDEGCILKYHNIEHNTFKNNLLFLDSCMPEFIADCLEYSNMPDASISVKDVVEKVAEQNPFNYTGRNVLSFYEHKMKVLLLDAALGMTPSKEWAGKYDANGGYLVVRKDGEIVCYHFYDRNDVEDYLYANTRFERASRGRYGFGKLYRGDDEGVYIKLNLQIRFKK